MTLTAKQKLAAARRRCAQRAPYFTAGLHHLIYIPAPGLGQAGGMAVSNKGHLFYDPKTILEDWKVEDVATGLIHELGHVIRHHADRADRCGRAGKMIWNVAADCEINDDLAAGGWTLLPSDSLPSTYGFPDGRTAEEYVRLLEQSGKAPPEPVQVTILLGDAADDGDDAAGKGKGAGDGKGERGKHPCGSGAGCTSTVEDQLRDLAKAAGAPDRTPAETSGLRRRTAEAIRQHLENKGRGSVPGGWVRWAEGELEPPKIRWQDRLSRACKQALVYIAGRTDYTYTRPSRRQGAFGYGVGAPIMPAMHSPKPEVLIGIDTSGSMGSDDLREAVQEVNGVLRAAGASVTVCAIDCAVQELKHINTVQDAIKMLKGGGGTSFIPLFDAAATLKPRPGLIIVCTDGWGPAPDVAPSWCETIWVLCGEGATAPCTWGTAINVHEAA